MNKIPRIRIDRRATQKRIYQLAAERYGYSEKTCKTIIYGASIYYKAAVKKTRLSLTEHYIVVAQALDMKMDDFIVVTED